MTLQSFTPTTRPEQGLHRLAALRAHLLTEGLQGFIIPRADAHQGENVAPCDDRLAWLTGFTGSAGLCVVLPDIAGLFIDGRYRLQVRAQADMTAFTPVEFPDTAPGPWIATHLANGTVGFDPWLHTDAEIEAIKTALGRAKTGGAKTGGAKTGSAKTGSAVALRAVPNMVDAIWADRPAPPTARAFIHPDTLAGASAQTKRTDVATSLHQAGHKAAVLTLPDSICWLANIRGADIPRTPIVQSFAIVHDSGAVDLFADPAKFDDDLRAHLGPEVRIAPMDAFLPALAQLAAPVRVDRATAPVAVVQALRTAGISIAWGQDPCQVPKACKSAAELDGMRAAHLRDGAAMAEFLAWLDAQIPAIAAGATLTEIDVVRALEGFRQATGALHDLAFETICGAGPNGAIVHYRVTEATNRPLADGDVLLVDSGAQYRDGTTDITRTIAIGTPPDAARRAATRVLQGMIAISRLRWPDRRAVGTGLAGRDLDAIARMPLWLAGQDYDHGTGHGVGAFLSVHEGPQRLSRISEVPLEPGMILSNEPGYYREGAFGIRLENLVSVTPAPPVPDGDQARPMLAFETLTLAPLDRRLFLTDTLTRGDRDWLDDYHAEVFARLAPLVSDATRAWLIQACAPL